MRVGDSPWRGEGGARGEEPPPGMSTLDLSQLEQRVAELETVVGPRAEGALDVNQACAQVQADLEQKMGAKTELFNTLHERCEPPAPRPLRRPSRAPRCARGVTAGA